MAVAPRPRRHGQVGISLVGFGNHVLAQHLPNLRAMSGVEIRGIASATGRAAIAVADKVRPTLVTTDAHEVMQDPGTDGVIIASAQPEHYEHLCLAIDAGKAILVEKPLVTRLDHFADILRRMRDEPVLLTVGLNRRYSPAVQRLRDALAGPVDSVTYTVTRPSLPPDHWSLDPVDGGGRLISEGEHFLDLCHFLVGRPPIAIYARALGRVPEDLRTLCNFAVTVHYDGAVANVVFDESASADFPQEGLTILAKGQVATLADFSRLTVHGKRVRKLGDLAGASMGHKEQLQQFVLALRGEPNHLLTWGGARTASLSVFAAQESIRTGEAIDLAEFEESLVAD
jgi:predicted dehydrogenase